MLISVIGFCLQQHIRLHKSVVVDGSFCFYFTERNLYHRKIPHNPLIRKFS